MNVWLLDLVLFLMVSAQNLPYLFISNQVHRARLKGDKTDVVVKVRKFHCQILDLTCILRYICLVIAGSASWCAGSDDD